MASNTLQKDIRYASSFLTLNNPISAGEELGQRRQAEDASFLAFLRACAKHKDLRRGFHLHNDVVRRGLLDEKCLDALVTMYARCGDLDRAQELLDLHNSRDVRTWTALIAGYVQKGEGENSLSCSERMRHEGLSPDAVTLTCILKACGSIEAADKGEAVHAEVETLGMLQGDIILGNALVDMYIKCGALAKALQVLEELSVRDVVSWNTLIAGYAESGNGEQALNCFERMQHDDGVCPDAVTYLGILKACGSLRAAEDGEKIHDHIAKLGLLGDNLMLGNALVDMYVKCGLLPKAQRALEELPVRNVISWNTLIAGYAQQGECMETVRCYEQMRHEGLSPDAVTFISLLKCYGSIGAIDKGKEIHEEIAKQGLVRSNLVLANALVGMYVKCGNLGIARQVLQELPARDVVSWNSLLAGYVQCGEFKEALGFSDKMQEEGLLPNAVTFLCMLIACGSRREIRKGEKVHVELAEQGLLESDIALGTAIVDMYAKCGALPKTQQVHEKLPNCNVTCWNALMGGYAQQREWGQSFKCLEEMQCKGLSPDSVSFICILKACDSMRELDITEKVHGWIVQQGMLQDNVVLGNALVDAYAKSGSLGKARGVLEGLLVRDLVSWNSIIMGYAQEGKAEQALDCLDVMQKEGLSPDAVTFTCFLRACSSIGALAKGEKIHDEITDKGLLGNDVVLGTALVDMYAKCSVLTRARGVLEELPVRAVATWNALIAGYDKHNDSEKVLECFELMEQEGLSPDAVTFIFILKACGRIGAIDVGGKIDGEIEKQGLLGDNVVLGTALVDMYAKCDALAKARGVLEQLPVRSVVTLNALISGHTQGLERAQVLQCFERMQLEGITPNAATLSHVLSACSCLGLVEEAQVYFTNMSVEFNIDPVLEHYTCMVDLLGRAGHLDKAQQVLEELPVRDVIAWNALLAGYNLHNEGEQALKCFERMQHEGLSPDMVTFIYLLKACGNLGAVEKGGEIHDALDEQGLLEGNVVLSTAVVDMYARCGTLAKARGVLEELPIRNVATWTALIGGYAYWCEGALALKCFEKMQLEGISPTAPTFSCVLSVCSRLGLVEEAQLHFSSIRTQFGIKPDLELYTCMVDLFGRAGHFDRALQVVEKMPCFGRGLWSALLTACQKWGDVNVGKWAFDEKLGME